MTAGEPGVAEAAPDDPVGFGLWVRPHLRQLANLVARLAPGADRDDVVQDALARAWVKRSQFDPRRGTPAAWLLAIAADQAAKARRRARPASPLADTDAGTAPEPTRRPAGSTWSGRLTGSVAASVWRSSVSTSSG